MVEVRGLTKTLPNGRVLLDHVSFKVAPGEFVGILGASGAGKTLTIRALVGLTPVQGGEANVDGMNITKARGRELRKARARIGLIFQGLQLVKRLTVLENVMIGRLGLINPWRSWLYGFTDAEARAALAVLERVGLVDFADRVTASLSGGEMQRVAIARAIFQEPRIYLADEPISSLDPKNSELVMRLLQELARESLVLGAFHQPSMTSRFCTRVIGMRNGQVIHDGPAELSHAQLRELYGAELASLEARPGADAEKVQVENVQAAAS
jgi:phosphonate transport system ATP-binding protein